jgi:hypothetical protein
MQPSGEVRCFEVVDLPSPPADRKRYPIQFNPFPISKFAMHPSSLLALILHFVTGMIAMPCISADLNQTQEPKIEKIAYGTLIVTPHIDIADGLVFDASFVFFDEETRQRAESGRLGANVYVMSVGGEQGLTKLQLTKDTVIEFKIGTQVFDLRTPMVSIENDEFSNVIITTLNFGNFKPEDLLEFLSRDGSMALLIDGKSYPVSDAQRRSVAKTCNLVTAKL